MPDHVWEHLGDVTGGNDDVLVAGAEAFRHEPLVATLVEVGISEPQREGVQRRVGEVADHSGGD